MLLVEASDRAAAYDPTSNLDAVPKDYAKVENVRKLLEVEEDVAAEGPLFPCVVDFVTKALDAREAAVASRDAEAAAKKAAEEAEAEAD